MVGNIQPSIYFLAYQFSNITPTFPPVSIPVRRSRRSVILFLDPLSLQASALIVGIVLLTRPEFLTIFSDGMKESWDDEPGSTWNEALRLCPVAALYSPNARQLELYTFARSVVIFL